MNNCFGCGITLQDTKPTAVGFIPSAKMEEETALCKRCFSIKHYNKTDITVSNSFNPYETITSMNIKHSVIAVVCDIYSLSNIGKIFKEFKHLLKDNRVWIIVNKIDLLPKSVNQSKLREKLIHALKSKYRYNKIMVISSYKMWNIDEFFTECNQAKRNIYLLGYVNSGKSSIANSILKMGGASQDELILKSHVPNTTLGEIKVPVSKTHKLVDLPGIPSDLDKFVTNDEIKKIYNLGEQKAITFQLNPGQKVYFDNFGYIEFVSGDKTNATFYINNALKLHRTKSENKNPDISANIKMFNMEKVETKLIFDEAKTIDIEIPNIGFVRLDSVNQEVKIYSTFLVSVRNSII